MESESKHVLADDTMVGFLGAGRMAQAMSRGFIASGLIKPTSIIASDPDSRMLTAIQDLGVRVTKSNREVVENCNVIVIAVKPSTVLSVLREVKPVTTSKNLFVSIAAGVPIASLESELPSGTRVVRVMPNTPALVLQGASVFARGNHTLPEDADLVSALFTTVGLCAESTENHLDAVTGLSGSGPAYAFMAIEALSDGGVKMGLPRDIAIKLAAQTLLGAAKMVLETGQHPGQLKDAVCSPGGTTIHAVHDLERMGFRASLISAVESATRRSQELGRIQQQEESRVATERREPSQSRL